MDTSNQRSLRRLPLAVLGIALLLVAALPGCDNVAVEPKSKVTAERIFQNEESYTQYLAKLYAGLNVTGQIGPTGDVDIFIIDDEGFSQYMRLYWQMQELPADGAVFTFDDAGGVALELSRTNLNENNTFVSAMYSRIFFQVAHANEFLRQSTSGKLSERNVSPGLAETIQTEFRAEARFLRALSYYHALDLFGGVPIVEESFPRGAQAPPYPSDSGDREEARRAVFEFVESELLAIAGETGDTDEVLPDVGAQDYGRADKAAAWMILAKMYLNAEVYANEARYDDAVTYAQKVIDAGYTLEEDYRDLFLADNHTANGVIFAIPHDGQRTQHFGGTQFLTHGGVITGDKDNDMDPANYGVDFGYSTLRTLPETVNLYSSSDQRVMFENTPASESQFFTRSQTLEVNDLTDRYQGYAVPKWQNVSSTGVAGGNPTFPETDLPVFRLADAYLIYAEAVLRGASNGSQSTAVEYVNNVRERAGLGRDIDASELTLDFMIDERGREFIWEGHRRSDLVRFGLFTGSQYVWSWKGGQQSGASLGACKDVYPLPVGELSANPNLPPNESC